MQSMTPLELHPPRGVARHRAPGHPCLIRCGGNFFGHVPTSPRPTGTRSHAPTAVPPGGLPAPRIGTSPRPTGTRSHAPTEALPGDLPSPHAGTSPRSTGTCSHAPTATPPGGLPSPRSRTCTRSTGTRSDAPTEHLQVTSRAAAEHVHIVPRAPVLTRPLQHLKLSSLRRVMARLRVPRAPVLTRPLQHLQVPPPRTRRPPVPRAAYAPRRTPLVPRAPVLMRPLKHFQVAFPAAYSHVPSCHGHPFWRPLSTSRCPLGRPCTSTRERDLCRLTSRHSRPFSSNSCISHTIASASPVHHRFGERSHVRLSILPRSAAIRQICEDRARARVAVDHLAARPPRHRESGPEPSELFELRRRGSRGRGCRGRARGRGRRRGT